MKTAKDNNHYQAIKRREQKREIRWISQKDANHFIAKHHRHHKPVVGSITQIGLWVNAELVGVAILGRPVSRHVDFRSVIEVTRLATNGSDNACSQLYGAAARIAKELGFTMIQTYLLENETGISLKASGWHQESGVFGGVKWHGRPNTNLFGELKAPEIRKHKYFKVLQIVTGQNGA